MTGETQQPAAAQSAAPQVSGPRAGFGSRLAAILIDVVIVLVIQFAIGFVFGVILGALGEDPTDPGGSQILILGANLINVVVAIVYFALQEGSARGQTLGKRALGIRVVDFNTGGSIGVGRAVFRYLARILSSIPLFLGYFWMLWDPQKQTWHDKLISDVVVPVSAYPIEGGPAAHYGGGGGAPGAGDYYGGGYTPPQTGSGN